MKECKEPKAFMQLYSRKQNSIHFESPLKKKKHNKQPQIFLILSKAKRDVIFQAQIRKKAPNLLF